MKFLFVIFTLAVSLALSGCRSSETPSPQAVTWTKNQGPAPALFSSTQFSQPERSVLVANEVVSFSKQRWGPAMIEGGSLQRIDNRAGTTQYGKAHFLISPELQQTISDDELNLLFRDRFIFLAALREKRVLPKELFRKTTATTDNDPRIYPLRNTPCLARQE